MKFIRALIQALRERRIFAGAENWGGYSRGWTPTYRECIRAAWDESRREG